MASALDVFRVVAEFVYVGQQVLNVYHAITADAGDDLEVGADICEAIDAAMVAQEDVQDDSIIPVSFQVVNVTSENDVGTFAWTNYAGGIFPGTTGLPSGVAALTTFTTNVIGSRGRKFIAGISEANNVDSVFDAALVGFMEDYADIIVAGFIGSLSGAALKFGVRPEVGTFRPFNGYLVSNIPAYQRRRKAGVGS